MTPAAYLFLAALTAVCALSVWVGTWGEDCDGCGEGER